MLIHLYAIDRSRGIYSFRPQPGAEPVEVKVPDGSEMKVTRGLGLDLFVPSAWDKLQLIRWPANVVMREAQARGRFRLVSSKLERSVG